MLGSFVAAARLSETADWERFVRMLERKGRARLAVSCALESEGVACGAMDAMFVAIDTSR